MTANVLQESLIDRVLKARDKPVNDSPPSRANRVRALVEEHRRQYWTFVPTEVDGFAFGFWAASALMIALTIIITFPRHSITLSYAPIDIRQQLANISLKTSATGDNIDLLALFREHEQSLLFGLLGVLLKCFLLPIGPAFFLAYIIATLRPKSPKCPDRRLNTAERVHLFITNPEALAAHDDYYIRNIFALNPTRDMLQMPYKDVAWDAVAFKKLDQRMDGEAEFQTLPEDAQIATLAEAYARGILFNR